MGKQAMGSFCLNHHNRFYTTYRVLHRGSRAFTETDTYFVPKMDIMPSGQTINVAFTTDPDNQEDAVVISRAVIRRALNKSDGIDANMLATLDADGVHILTDVLEDAGVPKKSIDEMVERLRGKQDESEPTRNKRSVWEVTTKPYSGAHFATFPPDLIKPCILAGCPAGGTVLDPFGGSGTTGMVALELGRNAELIELNPDYVEIIEGRTHVTPGLGI